MNVQKYVNAAKRFITDTGYRFIILSTLGLHNSMPDEEYLKKTYKAYIGRELNLDSPTSFNEKLQWIKLYDRNPEYTMMVDKYAVRAYISQKLGEDYLIPLLGVWTDPNDIDFEALPNQFVLKCNHNSGLGMCICKDKSKIDIEKVKKDLRKGLQENYFLGGREWPYKNVPRKIIAEKFMVDESGTELKDYKVLCFNGVPKFVEIHRGRFGKDHTQDFYDTSWQRMNYEQVGLPLAKELMPKPPFADEMFRLSALLAKDIPHVRVDWYYANNRLYFGELTFFDSSGFDPFIDYKQDEELGSFLILPHKK